MATIDFSSVYRHLGAVAALAKPRLLAWGRAAADLLVPPACALCHQPVTTHDSLCADCWIHADFIRAPLCDRLGIPLPFGLDDPMISARAAAEPPDFDRLRAVASHGGTMRELTHKLKYGDKQHLARMLSRFMASAGAPLLKDAELLIPIPLSRQRLWQRGFNQAAALASAISRRTGVPHDPMLLERRKDTQSQVGLTREQRADNLRGAFALAQGRADEVRGRNIVLVDDVVTTGATLNTAARVLRRAGARRIDALSVTLVTSDLPGWRRD